jgi:hypothetical protein
MPPHYDLRSGRASPAPRQLQGQLFHDPALLADDAPMSPTDLLPHGTTLLAYLDPASGSMLLQMIAAGVAGSWLVIKLWGRRLTMMFRRGDSDNEPGSSDE